ncbi:ABC transporter ATP-binding protein [Megasphaera paucivorans]|uniref:Iron complex transport system ATP-binding protein n=1 Tax=Megasphaera paucivorans TaxID=349095 RepID=A0A1G9S143_9FIRM|nr:ABC transporter ATP-binding protein [Megasphaera paucivorans]SDM29186.1 iron complex transport system ATP-binding protein [Megasphaera paucivorans]
MIESTDIVLHIHRLSAGYGTLTVLQNIDLTVHRGDMIGIIGPNGAGKSTLLKTIRGFLPIRQGVVELCGTPIGKLRAGTFAQQAAYLKQHDGLLPGYTVRDVVATGRYPHLHWWQQEGENDRRIVDACMQYTGVMQVADRDMLTLSGGQQQRVLLAKILAQQTPLLFLDEPTAGLDVFYQEEILRLCRVLCTRGKTVILVVHELALAARFCTKLILLGAGMTAAIGKPAEVLTEENLSAVYGMPIAVRQNSTTGHLDIYSAPSSASGRDALLDVIIGKTGGADHE